MEGQGTMVAILSGDRKHLTCCQREFHFNSDMPSHYAMNDVRSRLTISCFLSECLDHAEGRPHASWLRKVESYLKDMGMTGLASVWAMVRRNPI